VHRFNAPSLSDNVSRRWRDGSLELDLPTFLLSEMFNCNHFIVSQTNPHIAPLLNLKKSLSRRWANLLELELRHRWGLGPAPGGCLGRFGADSGGSLTTCECAGSICMSVDLVLLLLVSYAKKHIKFLMLTLALYSRAWAM
jgi:hypothetical protein